MKFKKINARNLISNLVSISLLLVVCFAIHKNGQSTRDFTWSTILSKILIFSIGALALNIVCGCLGEFALGHGGFLLIGYTVAVIVANFTKGFFDDATYKELVYTVRGSELHPLGYLLITSDVLVAALVTAVFGFIVGLISLGRLKGDYLAIVTLGVSLIFVNVAKNINVLGGAQGIGTASSLSGNPLIYAIFLVFTVFLILMFMKSRFGRGILAIRDDNIAAEASGVPVNKYKVMAFTFSAFIAGLAGGLYAHYNSFVPTVFGQDLSIELLIIVVLGGLGSLTGSIVSAAVIVIYNLWFCTRPWVPTFFSNNPKIIYGVILIAIMLFRSNGILGNAEFTWDWFYSSLKKVWNSIKNFFKKLFGKKASKEDK